MVGNEDKAGFDGWSSHHGAEHEVSQAGGGHGHGLEVCERHEQQGLLDGGRETT